MGRGKLPFKLPALPYETNALEPYISAPAMRSHHDIYHAACISNLDVSLGLNINYYGHWMYGVDITNEYSAKAWKMLEAMLTDSNSVPEKLKASARTNGGAHYNHTLFWQMMKPGGGGEPKGELADVIKKEFGSFGKFKEEFTKAAVVQPGNGWAWLTLDAGKLKVQTTTNEDTPFSAGRQVLLGVDVWDHAYTAQYGTNRKAYVDAWFHVVNWDFVADRYAKLKP